VLEEAVRNRPGMYFPTEPDSLGLPVGILQGVVGDALHAADGSHRPVDVEITSGLRFTVTDDQPPDLDDLGEPKPGFYGSLIGWGRVRAAAAALSTRTLIGVQVGGTWVTFDLDPAFLAPGAVISTSPEHLRASDPGCQTCASTQRNDTLTIRDHRP